jgi:D-alanyl-lipoteichoic acid acyltransferase DltB (MBOAT superfamily)
MIFTSIAFGIFFFVVALVYYILPGKLRWPWLLATGIYFYMQANPAYLLVPLCIILVTWFAGLKIESSASPRKATTYYVSAIAANIGILVFFKYANFFTSSVYSFLNFTRLKLFHANEALNNNLLVSLLPPLGISYITFQAIGYLIEIKRGNHPAEKNLGHFSTFLLFFPKIIAGPVERAHHFLPQLKKMGSFDYDNISAGLKNDHMGPF